MCQRDDSTQVDETQDIDGNPLPQPLIYREPAALDVGIRLAEADGSAGTVIVRKCAELITGTVWKHSYSTNTQLTWEVTVTNTGGTDAHHVLLSSLTLRSPFDDSEGKCASLRCLINIL